MKLKATKVFTKLLKNELAKDNRTKNYNIELAKLPTRAYELFVDIDRKSEQFDYDIATNEWRVIKIIYPIDYYANNKYITTYNLHKLWRDARGNYDAFIQLFIDEIEI